MDLKITNPGETGTYRLKAALPELGLKLTFRIETILSDDIDSICDARDNAKGINQLCLLSTGNVAILDSLVVQAGAELGPAALIRKYNQHPLVSKGTLPSIVKYVSITQATVEGVVVSDNAFKYLAAN